MRAITLFSLPGLFSKNDYLTWSHRMATGGIGLCLLAIPFLWKMRTALPLEELQGDSVQYLYIHVPWAFTALFLYGIAASLAAFYLLWPIKYVYFLMESCLWPIWLCSAGALFSGAIWGALTWGTYWVWDARLTSFLVLSVYVGLLLLWSHTQPRHLKAFRKTFCVLVCVGLLDVILTHFSVIWFQTLHQGPGLLRSQGSSLDPVFARPLWAHLLHMGIWNLSLVAGFFYQRLEKEHRYD